MIYLERAKTAPIDLMIQRSAPDICYMPVSNNNTSWVSRAKSLNIQADKEQIKLVVQRLCQKMPHLQSLTIIEVDDYRYRHNYSWTASPGGSIPFPQNFFGNHAPSLQTLTFHSVSPSNTFTFPLPKLTHINWVAETAHVSIERLLELFESSPLLEDIKMHVLVLRVSNLPLQEVTLNELHKLDWADCDGAISLVPCLVAPKLSHLKINVTHNLKPRCQGITETTLSSLLSPDPHRIPLLLKPINVWYACEPSSRSFGYLTSSGARLHVTENGSFTSCWFSQYLPISFLGTQKLELNVKVTRNLNLPPLDDFAIGRFENLSELDFVGEVDLLAHLISGQPVPCTALSKISINPTKYDHQWAIVNLMRVLDGRKEAGHEVKTVEIRSFGNMKDIKSWGSKRVVDEVRATRYV